MRTLLKAKLASQVNDTIDEMRKYTYEETVKQEQLDEQEDETISNQREKAYFDQEAEDEDNETTFYSIWDRYSKDTFGKQSSLIDVETVDQEILTITGKKKKKTLRDPFLKFGPGIKIYFLLQGQLIKSYCILSIFAIIQMIIMC